MAEKKTLEHKVQGGGGRGGGNYSEGDFTVNPPTTLPKIRKTLDTVFDLRNFLYI